MVRDLRWAQRFENFDKALRLLREAIQPGSAKLSDLEKEGVVQRFEYTFELAWKTLRDYLEFTGIKLDLVTPRTVVKEAFAARILPDGQLWVDMLEHRNLLAHTYDAAVFANAVSAIADRYLVAVEGLHSFLGAKSTDE